MSILYPLRFAPLFRRYLWGGRRFQTVLGKSLPPGDDYAESWEIADRGADQSAVASGPLQGSTLHQIVASHGAELLGRHHPQPIFPLLMKFLDARQTLSVQVHPSDRQAAELELKDSGKTEAWYVLAAEPDSFVYGGLKPGVDRSQLAQAIARGDCENSLHRLEPRPGDCLFLPAGTVHAVGPGLLLAEIQQSSDVTFRLFDFNRLGPDGKRRPLHVEDALSVIDFERGPLRPQVATPTDRSDVERLVECPYFVWDRWTLREPAVAGGDERFHIVTVVEGEVLVEGDPAGCPLRRGETMLLPAAVATKIAPLGRATLLDAYLP